MTTAMTTLSGSSGSLIPEAAAREGNDPIFALHGEAVRRAAAGESILNSTLGALMYDDGSLAVMPAAAEALGRVPHARAAGYAPISGDPPYLAAVIADLLGEGGLAEQAVAVATPCCPAPVSAMIRGFPIRFASNACPTVLLILCAPVWLRSSRFR